MSEMPRNEKLSKNNSESDKKRKEYFDSLKVLPEPLPPPRRKKTEAQDKFDNEQEIKNLREELGVESGENKEKKENEMVERVLKESGIYVNNARFPKEFAKTLFPNGSSGYSDGSRSDFLRSNFRERLPVNPKTPKLDCIKQLGGEQGSLMRENSVYEFIDIRRVKEEIVEEKQIPAEKFLWITLEPARTDRTRTGRYKNIMHSEFVPNGKKEQAISFNYLYDNYKGYRDESGSDRVLSLSFIVPESTAKELEKMIYQDPKVMRKLVDKAMKEKILKDHPNMWTKNAENEIKLDNRGIQTNGHNSMRPDWEYWDKEVNGGRVYIQKEEGQKGWHGENVHQIKK